MSPLRLHAKLLVIYVLIGLAVTAVDGPLMRGSFINLAGALSLVYWALAGFVAVVSSLALPFARGREGVVVGAHIVAGALALPAFIALDVHDRNQGLKAVEEEEARIAAKATACSSLESWSWEERPRGTVHFFLNLKLGVPSAGENVEVHNTYRLGETTGQPLPEGAMGQRVVLELVAPRIDPEPFDNLIFYIPCPFAGVTYSARGGNSTDVARRLPSPTRSGAAAGILQGYDLMVSGYPRASRFLLRPASNADDSYVDGGDWLNIDALDATLERLAPHQTIGLWWRHGHDSFNDSSDVEATVVRHGHTLVKY